MNLNWTKSSWEEERLIPVGEIDTKGVLNVDSWFHHRYNAEKFARVLLARGAFIVVVGDVVFGRSKLAEEIGVQQRVERIAA